MTKRKLVVCTSAVKAHCSCYKGNVMNMGVKNVCCFCGKRRIPKKRKKK